MRKQCYGEVETDRVVSKNISLQKIVKMQRYGFLLMAGVRGGGASSLSHTPLGALQEDSSETLMYVL
jgi:hypothetical protein